MIISLVVSAIIMLLAVGFTGMCSFNTGSPENGQVPEVDASTFMSMEARAMTDHATRLPETPEGWTTNSARRTMVDDTPASVVGYVTADEGYIQLTQTGETVEDAVAGYDTRWRDLSESYDLDGHDVGIYTSQESDVRDLRVMDLGDARVMVSGAATDEEFNDLLRAVANSEPLPTN
ncbi:hypothetical protein C627_05530 [Corynebacterium glutamicum ZL-6]|nr:hypothetical protein AC079_05705 [Corynebacterium glutamicum]ANR62087.1 hypothetical protein C628_05555 [[Brevibacterium] flavum ZL-1]ANR65088.1 hypothetical protein C627_05530 [Corynebacterium glutamicum ZL-6]PST76046.1 hypothetical protein I919_05626 [Corynebacterium glutamicum ZL-2]ANU33254.1 hypothetical protein BBD29_05505 [Corynebacterium glutamicum]